MKITSDSFNPVLIKELRQHFHGKLFLITMGLLLLAQLATLFILYANSAAAEEGNRLVTEAMGPALFTCSLVTFGIACVLLCCLASLGRFMQERINPELDFTRFCAMSPLQILWGKMTSCYAIAIYLLSLCLPFLVIAYFLRGLSILNIALGVAFAIIGALLAIQIALFIGSIGQKSLMGILVFIVIWGSGGLVSIVVAIISSFTRRSTNLTLLFCIVFFLALVAIGFVFVLNLALLSSPYANRTMPARIYTIAIVLLSPLVGAFICYIPKSPMPELETIVTTIFIACVISSCLCSFIAAFERSVIGPRVQHQCPQSPLSRFGFFLISSGSGGGIVLAWIFQLIALAIVLCLFPARSSGYAAWPLLNVDAFVILIFGFASIFYTEIGLCVHKRFNLMPFAAWLVVTVIVLFIPLLLYAFATFTYEGKGYKLNHMLITTPFYPIALAERSFLNLTSIACWFEPALAVIGFFIAFKSILEQYKSLRISSSK